MHYLITEFGFLLPLRTLEFGIHIIILDHETGFLLLTCMLELGILVTYLYIVEFNILPFILWISIASMLLMKMLYVIEPF